MYESFGFQIDKTTGEQSVSLFIPDNAVDPTQYVRGGPSRIASVALVGDFQSIVAPGATDWDAADGLELTKEAHAGGAVWRYRFPQKLPDGFYQYLFVVTFENGATRTVGDP
jgi:hypothetical protein